MENLAQENVNKAVKLLNELFQNPPDTESQDIREFIELIVATAVLETANIFIKAMKNNTAGEELWK